MDKDKKVTKGIPHDLANKVRPEVVQALKKSHQQYNEAYKNLRDR